MGGGVEQREVEMPDGSAFLGDRLLRRNEVEAMIAVSTATLYKMIKEGRFPSAVHLGAGTVRWRLSEVQSWLASLEAHQNAEPPVSEVSHQQRRKRGRPAKRPTQSETED